MPTRLTDSIALAMLVTACAPAHAPESAAGASPAGTTAGLAPCPGEDPEPPARTRPPGERPFVEVIPREETALTRSRADLPVSAGKATCKVGSDVWRDAEGRVRVCTVAIRVTLFGVDIAKDAYTHFHADGRPFQTHTARALELSTARGQTIRCAPDLVVLSATGSVEHCTLERTVELGGVACRGGEDVAFHPTGELAGARLDAPVSALGTSFPAGTDLYWFPSGKLSGGYVREPLRVAGFLVQYRFAFFASGVLRAFELAEPRTLNGEKFPARAQLELRRDGTLKRAEYETDSGVMPHGEPWQDTRHARYDCKGKLVGAYTDHYQAPLPPPRFRPRGTN